MSDPMHNHVLFLHGSDLSGANNVERVTNAVVDSGMTSVLLADSFRRRMTSDALTELCTRLRDHGRIVGAHVVPPEKTPHRAWLALERRVLLRVQLLRHVVYADGAERYTTREINADQEPEVDRIHEYLDGLEFDRKPTASPRVLRMCSAWWQCAHRLTGGPACLDPPRVYDAGPAEFTSAILDHLDTLDRRVAAFTLLYPGAPLARLYGWIGRIMGPTDRPSRALGDRLLGEVWRRARRAGALVVWQTDTDGLEEDARAIREALEA